MIRRINLYGGPSSSKSTTAARLFADLKDAVAQTRLNKKVEHVQEWCKPLAYEGCPATGFEQLQWFTEQLRSEERFLRNGVDIIVSDSPLYLNTYYACRNKVSFWTPLANIADTFEGTYPSLNFFINRGSRPYNPAGRFQTADEVASLDDNLKNYLVNRIFLTNVIVLEQEALPGLSENVIDFLKSDDYIDNYWIKRKGFEFLK